MAPALTKLSGIYSHTYTTKRYTMQSIKHQLYWIILTFALNSLIIRERYYANQFSTTHKRAMDVTIGWLHDQYNREAVWDPRVQNNIFRATARRYFEADSVLDDETVCVLIVMGLAFVTPVMIRLQLQQSCGLASWA
jgi:hypothetical protein